VKILFLMLTNMTGILSALLDNVTCVMLVGPVTISLCNQMGIDPVPFYLAETICATIGGAATMIGDPPNVVLGSKYGLGFTDFIRFNGPLVLVMMPVSRLCTVAIKIQIQLQLLTFACHFLHLDPATTRSPRTHCTGGSRISSWRKIKSIWWR
jgi:Na+/H+ antiporter NhaD/arsenite permease-like protein